MSAFGRESPVVIGRSRPETDIRASGTFHCNKVLLRWRGSNVSLEFSVNARLQNIGECFIIQNIHEPLPCLIKNASKFTTVNQWTCVCLSGKTLLNIHVWLCKPYNICKNDLFRFVCQTNTTCLSPKGLDIAILTKVMDHLDQMIA